MCDTTEGEREREGDSRVRQQLQIAITAAKRLIKDAKSNKPLDFDDICVPGSVEREGESRQTDEGERRLKRKVQSGSAERATTNTAVLRCISILFADGGGGREEEEEEECWSRGRLNLCGFC